EPEHHVAGERADERDRDPEEREHRAEAQDEREGVRERSAALRPGEGGLAGHVHEERRHEREHARREEREDPCTERDRDIHSNRLRAAVRYAISSHTYAIRSGTR